MFHLCLGGMKRENNFSLFHLFCGVSELYHVNMLRALSRLSAHSDSHP